MEPKAIQLLRPKPGSSDNSVTALLVQLGAGNREVEASLIPQVYSELRRLAAHYMRSERGNHTLQPTALVNEAYSPPHPAAPRFPGRAVLTSSPPPRSLMRRTPRRPRPRPPGE